jgi:HEAT repeat protein
MQVLVRGTIEDVWRALETKQGPDLSALGDPEAETLQNCRPFLLAQLSRAVSRTDDVRIAARVVDAIDFADKPLLGPVLTAALAHGSSDVRRHAACAAATAEDPTLAPVVEERFMIETDAGVRRDLMRALEATKSRRLLPELRTIATSGDAESRSVALKVLASLPDVDSVALFESVAMGQFDGEPGLAAQAVEALGLWRDIPGTNAAIRAVGRFGPADAARAAIATLSDPDYGDVVGLAEIASARKTADDRSLSDQAQSAIGSLTSPERAERITLSCGGRITGIPVRQLPLALWETTGLDSIDDQYVTPASGGLSSRCWDAPGFMWLGEIRARIPSGTAVIVKDGFSWNGEDWRAVISPEQMCWVPKTELSEEEHGVSDEQTALEFDVGTDDAQSWAARSLERGNWLTWLAADDAIVELRLDANRSDREAVGALVRIRRDSDSPAITLAIARWLFEHAQNFSEDKEWGAAIPNRDPRWSGED